jgi:hypothetical protein
VIPGCVPRSVDCSSGRSGVLVVATATASPVLVSRPAVAATTHGGIASGASDDHLRPTLTDDEMAELIENLDTLAGISRRLESIEYHVRVR